MIHPRRSIGSLLVLGSLVATGACGSTDVATTADPTEQSVPATSAPDASPGADRSLSDEDLAALRMTRDAAGFDVTVDIAGQVQSLRYVAPNAYESTDPSAPLLVVGGIQYERPPSLSPQDDPDSWAPLPLPSAEPFFLAFLDPGSTTMGPGFEITAVETDGTYATVVHAELTGQPITLTFSSFGAGPPVTAPTNTVAVIQDP